jgi:hypothetical protein
VEAAVLWKAALRSARLPTGLGKRFAFPTATTAPAVVATTDNDEPTLVKPTTHVLSSEGCYLILSEASGSWNRLNSSLSRSA